MKILNTCSAHADYFSVTRHREAAKPRASVGRATFLLAAMVIGGSGCGASGAATTPGEPPAGSSVEHARCRTDDDCVLNPVDCSECGRCPGDEPVAVMRSEVGSLMAECERHPPVRLDPQAAAVGLQRPACSPCPLGLNEPRPVWRIACKGGSCAVEQAGTEQPYQGGELTPSSRLNRPASDSPRPAR